MNGSEHFIKSFLLNPPPNNGNAEIVQQLLFVYNSNLHSTTIQLSIHLAPLNAHNTLLNDEPLTYITSDVLHMHRLTGTTILNAGRDISYQYARKITSPQSHLDVKQQMLAH